ncbi:MAG: hypothetical protein ACNS62_01480 [Candidatus Cyclobacteriaceae bacterium M3_2C_046]
MNLLNKLYQLLAFSMFFFLFTHQAEAQRFRLEEADKEQLEVSFDAVRTGNSIQFIWNSSSETNIKSYEIRRGTEDGRFLNWEVLTSISIDKDANNYSFTDSDPILGEMNYRLRLVAPDGSSVEYSPLFKIGQSNSQVSNKISHSPEFVKN